MFPLTADYRVMFQGNWYFSLRDGGVIVGKVIGYDGRVIYLENAVFGSGNCANQTEERRYEKTAPETFASVFKPMFGVVAIPVDGFRHANQWEGPLPGDGGEQPEFQISESK